MRFYSKLSNLRRSWKFLTLCPVGQKFRLPWGLQVISGVGQYCEGIRIVGSTLTPGSWCVSQTDLEDTHVGSENWCKNMKALDKSLGTGDLFKGRSQEGKEREWDREERKVLMECTNCCFPLWATRGQFHWGCVTEPQRTHLQRQGGPGTPPLPLCPSWWRVALGKGLIHSSTAQIVMEYLFGLREIPEATRQRDTEA